MKKIIITIITLSAILFGCSINQVKSWFENSSYKDTWEIPWHSIFTFTYKDHKGKDIFCTASNVYDWFISCIR